MTGLLREIKTTTVCFSLGGRWCLLETLAAQYNRVNPNVFEMLSVHSPNAAGLFCFQGVFCE